MDIELIKRMMDACYQGKRIRDMLPPLPEDVYKRQAVWLTLPQIPVLSFCISSPNFSFNSLQLNR